jgi:Asp/Glu/hydantoin racemase
MGIRILGVHAMAAEKDSPEGAFCQVAAGIERDCMKRIANSDTEIVMRFPRWGFKGGIDGFFHPLTNHLNDRTIYHQIVNAEKEGFDAAMIICLFDSLLREIRTAVDIPVIGLFESALHMAAIIGGKFGVLCLSPETTFDNTILVDAYGLRQKCVGVLPMKDTHTGWLSATMQSPETMERTIEYVSAPARELIKRGAEVILIA